MKLRNLKCVGKPTSRDIRHANKSRYCSSVCAACRQLQRVRRSLDDESTKTLVHAFVMFRVDYYNTVHVSSPKSVTDKLQRVLNARQRHTPWTDLPSTNRLALARCGRVGPVQARCDSPPVSALCTTKHHSTRQTTASQSQTSLVVSATLSTP